MVAKTTKSPNPLVTPFLSVSLCETHRDKVPRLEMVAFLSVAGRGHTFVRCHWDNPSSEGISGLLSVAFGAAELVLGLFKDAVKEGLSPTTQGFCVVSLYDVERGEAETCVAMDMMRVIAERTNFFTTCALMQYNEMTTKQHNYAAKFASEELTKLPLEEDTRNLVVGVINAFVFEQEVLKDGDLDKRLRKYVCTEEDGRPCIYNHDNRARGKASMLSVHSGLGQA